MLGDSLKKAMQAPNEPVQRPSGYYSPDGECVFVYNEGGEYVAQRVDARLTVFRSPDDSRIIGVQIKDVTPGEVVGVGIHRIARSEHVRVDAVVLLLRSLDKERIEEPLLANKRTETYAEVLRSLGCARVDVELATSASDN